MPKFRQHLQINLVCLGAVELSAQLREIERNPGQNFDWERFLVAVGVGSFAGGLPDLLEPSLGNPNHRGFCHSLAAVALVWWLVKGRHTVVLSEETRRALVAIGIGYSAHIGADLFFSKGKRMGLMCPEF